MDAVKNLDLWYRLVICAARQKAGTVSLPQMKDLADYVFSECEGDVALGQTAKLLSDGGVLSHELVSGEFKKAKDAIDGDWRKAVDHYRASIAPKPPGPSVLDETLKAMIGG